MTDRVKEAERVDPGFREISRQCDGALKYSGDSHAGTPGGWRALYFCVECGRELGDKRYAKDAVCCYCGHLGCILCTTRTRVARWRRAISPWWKFKDNRGYWEFKEEK